MILFLLGLLIGVYFGFLACALLISAGNGDRYQR